MDSPSIRIPNIKPHALFVVTLRAAFPIVVVGVMMVPTDHIVVISRGNVDPSGKNELLQQYDESITVVPPELRKASYQVCTVSPAVADTTQEKESCVSYALSVPQQITRLTCWSIQQICAREEVMLIGYMLCSSIKKCPFFYST